MTLLKVTSLSVSLGTRKKRREVVKDVSFDVGAGETLCIVGESGSGKSVTAKAIIDLLPKHALINGSITMGDQSLLNGEASTRRGRDIGMIFQEPMTALNPVLTIGKQMTEASQVLGGISHQQANSRALELLDRVGIDNAKTRMQQYPHEFSGGMRQRAMIAMSMMMSPKLLIADEPTTALDVTIQAQILQLLRTLVDETGMAMILITHDMGVVAENADRVMVMKDGESVETADVHSLFRQPQHSYTRLLLDAVPRLDVPSEIDSTATRTKPVVDVNQVSKSFRRNKGWLRGGGEQTRALDNVSLQIHEGETLALVGESGSGKSTLGRAITRLLPIDDGRISINNQDIATLKGEELRRARARTQMIFQDPYSSLDPRFNVGRTVAEPMIIQGSSRQEAQTRSAELLAKVGLNGDVLERFPHEFSGGQRQRIAIARALATNPTVLVADEPTSALDVSIQAQILDLLAVLREERRFSTLFISHDLAVVRRIANRVAVMRHGKIVELGPTEMVLTRPQQEYTKLLINSAPIPDPTRRIGKLAVAGVGSET